MKNKKGFTLIELLIVIGILAVLAVTLLLALNPGEAQKRTRDTKRMKDVSTLQAVLEQYISNGGAPICIVACTTAAAGTAQNQSCATNFLGVNLCALTTNIPLDPNNNVTRNVVTGGTVAAPTFGANVTIYRVMMDAGGAYEINVRQESGANASNVLMTASNGNSDGWVEIGTDPGLDLMAN